MSEETVQPQEETTDQASEAAAPEPPVIVAEPSRADKLAQALAAEQDRIRGQAEIRRARAEQAKLKSEYDQRLQALEQQLAETRPYVERWNKLQSESLSAAQLQELGLDPSRVARGILNDGKLSPEDRIEKLASELEMTRREQAEFLNALRGNLAEQERAKAEAAKQEQFEANRRAFETVFTEHAGAFKYAAAKFGTGPGLSAKAIEVQNALLESGEYTPEEITYQLLFDKVNQLAKIELKQEADRLMESGLYEDPEFDLVSKLKPKSPGAATEKPRTGSRTREERIRDLERALGE